MKRISIFVTALAFFVILTQCKKEEQVTPINESGTVAITLDIKGNDGTRMDVNTSTGEVTYEEGDVVYVVSGGKYIGALMHNGTNFNGTITDPTVGEPLYFYFLGNVTPVETLTVGTTQSCSVIISDQTERLPVIECAPSNEMYISGATTFTAMLLNKCALVKFNVVTASEAAICVTGFNNKVAIDFSDVSFTYSMIDGGNISLPAGSGEIWAILLPQEAMEAGEAGSAYSMDGAYTGTRGAVPAIADNGYLIAGIEVTVTTEVNPGEVPIGAINGKFTINEDGDQIYFSQGNLQYIGSATTPYWKFAENQWDYFGTSQDGNSQTIDRDLFGWGTSGWNNGNMYYQPYDTESFWDNQIGYGYGPTDGTNYEYDLTGEYANADWGIYNAISNGGNVPNLWRTLTKSEWAYILSGRATASGFHYAKAVVNGINGIILLPDNWSSSVYTINYTNTANAPFTVNEITLSDWEILETNGAVFLPAAGYRNGTSVEQVGSYGGYWTSAVYSKSLAYGFGVYPNSITNPGMASATVPLMWRKTGNSVRLVCSAE